jgi:hypothetical protein
LPTQGHEDSPPRPRLPRALPFGLNWSGGLSREWGELYTSVKFLILKTAISPVDLTTTSTRHPMKPKPPEVQLSTWQRLYATAQRVRDLEPWKLLDDLDLVVVRDPPSNQTGHCVFMGSGKSVFGFCVYRGAEGFYRYKSLIDDSADETSDEFIFSMDCLELEFGARGDLGPEDLRVIAKLGLTFEGTHAWPEFRSMLPGYAPWFLTESEARFLTLCLEAGCFHHERVDQMEIDESFREREYLVYTPVEHPPGFQASWEKWPKKPAGEVFTPVLDLALIESLRPLSPVSGQRWQADVFRMHMQIMDKDRPYVPRMAAICDEASGFVLDTELFPPGEPTSQLFINVVCSAAQKNQMLPETVVVKGNAEAAALASLAKVLGFKVLKRKPLRAINAFKTAVIKDMPVWMRGRTRQ